VPIVLQSTVPSITRAFVVNASTLRSPLVVVVMMVATMMMRITMMERTRSKSHIFEGN